MGELLLGRLERAVAQLLEQNQKLKQECLLLRQEKDGWIREKEELLAEVESILSRFDAVDLEEF